MQPLERTASLSHPVDHQSVTTALAGFMSSPANQQGPKLYFGYGSNLWVQQMHSRCPDSHFVGIARLNGYKWIINSRGYANVVELPKGSPAETQNAVWGLVFYLKPDDEKGLDRNEGVPYAYAKEMLHVDFWPSKLHDLQERIDVSKDAVAKEVLVYIDRKRLRDDEPKTEYVFRMNKGIDDAVTFGIPQEYVEKVMRKFIPKEKSVDQKTLKKAQKQALEFRDEEESE